MKQSKAKRSSNRSARILTTVFSIIIVLTFVLSLVGPEVFRGSPEPTSIPTRALPTPTASLTPTPSPAMTLTPSPTS